MKWKREWLWFYMITMASVLGVLLWGSKAVTVISESQAIERKHCIIIDAGHGGVDGGAISCTGIPESKYNLEIAQRLNDMFRLIGYDTYMIRTSDISVYTKGETIAQKKVSDLKERVRIANEIENGVYISIHQNMFSDSKYSGAQVFYAKTKGSDIWANTIQSGFAATVNPGSRRKSKPSNKIYIMEHVASPAVLIECGFLSNPREEALLRNREYQQKLCCIIASATDSCLLNT